MTVLPVHAPLDGSPEGERALPLAVALAARLGAPLVLVHAIEPLPPLTADDVAPVVAAGLYDPETARAAGREYLAGVAARVGGGVATTLVEGAPADAVADHVRQVGASLVVMPTHAHGAIARALLGSVALDVVRTTRVPVLLVPPHAETPVADRAAAPLPAHVLLPTDGSAFAERIVEVVAPLAAACGARCTVLGVVEPIVAATAMLPAEAEPGDDDLASRMGRMTARLRAAGVGASATVEPQGRPARATAEWAASHGADLIAMTTHSPHGIGRLMSGSVADAVVQHAHCPVLLWHPED